MAARTLRLPPAFSPRCAGAEARGVFAYRQLRVAQPSNEKRTNGGSGVHAESPMSPPMSRSLPPRQPAPARTDPAKSAADRAAAVRAATEQLRGRRRQQQISPVRRRPPRLSDDCGDKNMSKPPITLVLARASNGVIGKDGGLPYISAVSALQGADMARSWSWARTLTASRSAAGRRHIVLTRDRAWRAAASKSRAMSIRRSRSPDYRGGDRGRRFSPFLPPAAASR